MSRTEGPFAAACDDLSVTYRAASSRVVALREVSATFPRGRLSAVVGPSGSGKSSLLRTLAGLARPTSGRIVVEGVRVDRASLRAQRSLRRRRVAFLFQRPSDNLLPFLDVEEQLRAAAIERGGEPPLDPEEVLQRLGIGHRLRERPVQLSGGEQQRIALATALVRGADLVLADEPTSELDTASGASVLESMRAIIESGATFIVATHDQAVVAAADHVVELEHGAVRMRPSFGIAPPAPAPRGTRGVVPPESGGSAEILRVEEVMKSYGEGSRRVMAVRHVSLRLSRGEFVAIVGRSGSGKTTLLNVIAGWERPDSGEVTWPGTEEDRLLHWGIVAVVPQRLGLLDELTVAENVEYPARLMGSLGEHRASGDHLLRDLGIDHLAGRYPTETSIGEQQRTALARALSLRPTLLIADEPTGHQDASSTARVVAAIREATGSGTSALVATHDFRLAQHADRVLRMRDGRLVDS